MDEDGAGGLGGSQENSPGFLAETADEESFCFFGVMLEMGGAQSKVLLKGVPIAYLRSKGCFGEVWSEVLVENTEEADDGAPTTSKKVREDAKETTVSIPVRHWKGIGRCLSHKELNYSWLRHL